MLASNIPCDICWKICYRSTGILDIQPYIQLHRPGKKGKQVKKGNEPSYHVTWLKKMFSIHDFCTFNLKKSFYFRTYLFFDRLDSLLVDPAHPRHTVFKSPDDTFHHHFHLERKHFVMTMTTKDTTEKAIRISLCHSSTHT